MVATAAANVSAGGGRVTRTLSRTASGRAVLATGRWTKRIAFGTAAVVLGGGALISQSDEGLSRTLRVLRSIAPMFVDFQATKFRVRALPAEEQDEAFAAYHQHWANEPLKMCLELRGYYLKLGQALAGQPDLLPDAYGRSLKVLQTEVPPKPFRVIKDIVERELGCALGDAFATFDEAPLGSASIGQVHRATLAARRVMLQRTAFLD